MPDWNRPRRVHNMRRVVRQQTGKKPSGCDFWVLCALLVVAVVFTVVRRAR